MTQFRSVMGETQNVAHETEIDGDNFIASVKPQTQIKLRTTTTAAGFPVIGFSAEEECAERDGVVGEHWYISGFFVVFRAAIDAAIRAGRGLDVSQNAGVNFVG